MFCAGFSNNSVGMWHWCWHLGSLIWLCKISQRCLHSEQKRSYTCRCKNIQAFRGHVLDGEKGKQLWDKDNAERQVCGVIIEYSKYIHAGLLRMVYDVFTVHPKKTPKTVSLNFLCRAGTLKLTLVSFCCHIVHMWNMTWNQYVYVDHNSSVWIRAKGDIHHVFPLTVTSCFINWWKT